MIEVRPMLGLGDAIYSAPVIDWLARTRNENVHVVTSWPQLFRGNPYVWTSPTRTALRTQGKNECRELFRVPPAGTKCDGDAICLDYQPWKNRGISHWIGLCSIVDMPLHEYYLDLRRESTQHKENFVIVRPCTIRAEWQAPARNPKPEYIQAEIEAARSRGFQAVLIADIEEGKEEYDGPRPDCDIYFERGELSIDQIAALVAQCQYCISPVGFMIVMALAWGAQCRVIYGGAGFWDNPLMIDAPGAGKLLHVVPDNHCMCQNHLGNCCDKRISAYEQ